MSANQKDTCRYGGPGVRSTVRLTRMGRSQSASQSVSWSSSQSVCHAFIHSVATLQYKSGRRASKVGWMDGSKGQQRRFYFCLVLPLFLSCTKKQSSTKVTIVGRCWGGEGHKYCLLRLVREAGSKEPAVFNIHTQPGCPKQLGGGTKGTWVTRLVAGCGYS